MPHKVAHQRWTTTDERTTAKWIKESDRIDRMLAPFGQRMLDAAALLPGEHVLDIGCGTGATSVAAWELVAPTGCVTGIDISPSMLEAARGRVRAFPEASADFIAGDAQTYSFPPNAADVAISRFGVAHFDETLAAFKNIHEALRPGARFVFAEWTSRAENEWMSLTDDVARRALPELFGDRISAPEHSRGFAEEQRLRMLLATAGFHIELFERYRQRMWVGCTPQDVLAWFERVPEGRLLEALEPKARGKLLALLRIELERRMEPTTGVHLGATAWIVDCRA